MDNYAQLIKDYEGEPGARKAQHRYSPRKIASIEKRTIMGKPDADRICTSHAERLNLSVRMSHRRFQTS